MKKIKVFHQHNIAGVPGHISELLNQEKEFDSFFLSRKELDPFGFNEYYQEKGKGRIIPGKKTYLYYIVFVLTILVKRPQVVHIHAWIRGLKIALFLKKFNKNQYIIYHGHGSEIRENMNNQDIKYFKKANKIFVSTLDLKIKLLELDSTLDVEFLPNPIDTNLFYDRKNQEKNKALFIRYRENLPARKDFINQAKKFCKINNLELTSIITLENPIDFPNMAYLYSQFEYFLDFKGYSPNFSKAALEAGHCGCKVVQENFQIYNTDCIQSYNGSTRIIQFYKKLAIDLQTSPKEKHFWNKRYKQGLSSGLGSIGKLREFKWLHINRTINLQNKTVLDFGCGDLSFWNYEIKPDIKRYIGYDISKEIIKRHQYNFQDNKQIIFTNDIENLEKSDIVICFDVLFHIINDLDYLKTLGNLTRFTKEYLFIYTWKENPLRYRIPIPILRRYNLPIKKISDNKYQKYRDFTKYIKYLDVLGLKLVNAYKNESIDKIGCLYVFKR